MQSQTITRESLHKTLSYEKAACLMMVKLTPGVNFINVQQAPFMLVDPKSAKNIDGLTVFFALSGSSHAKTASRKVLKLTPDCN